MSKVVGIFVKFWHFLTMTAHRIWSCHVTQEANFEKFLYLPNFDLILGKVIKFLVEKPSTLEVIRQKPHGGWKTPSSVLLGLKFLKRSKISLIPYKILRS